MTIHGSCLCGGVTYEVEGDLDLIESLIINGTQYLIIG